MCWGFVCTMHKAISMNLHQSNKLEKVRYLLLRILNSCQQSFYVAHFSNICQVNAPDFFFIKFLLMAKLYMSYPCVLLHACTCTSTFTCIFSGINYPWPIVLWVRTMTSGCHQSRLLCSGKGPVGQNTLFSRVLRCHYWHSPFKPYTYQKEN